MGRGPSIPRAVISAITYKAITEGKRAPRIHKELVAQLGEGAVSLRQIQRYVKQARGEATLEEAYAPVSLKDLEALPPEEAAYIFSLARYWDVRLLEKDGKPTPVMFRPVLRGEMNWCLLVHVAAPDLPPSVVLGIANLYFQEHEAAQKEKRTPQTRHLDFGLIYRPWESENGKSAYKDAVEAGIISEAYTDFWTGPPEDRPSAMGYPTFWRRIGEVLRNRQKAEENEVEDER